MLRNIIMIVTCLVVGGAMVLILVLFIKRLNKIEEQRWGKNAAGKKDEPTKKKEKNA